MILECRLHPSHSMVKASLLLWSGKISQPISSLISSLSAYESQDVKSQDKQSSYP